MRILVYALAGVLGPAMILTAYWLGVKNTEAIFRAHGLLKPGERFIRRETQWPNFTWVKEVSLLKPSEKKK